VLCPYKELVGFTCEYLKVVAGTSHANLAKYIQQQHEFRTLEDTEELLIYRDAIYHPKGEVVIKHIVEQLYGSHTTRHYINEVIAHIKRNTYTPREDFDRNPNLIVCENGILDRENSILLDHTPHHLALTKIHTTFDQQATSPRINHFLNEVCPDLSYQQTLIEWAGYCLYHGYPFHCWLILLGGGRNGKSTFLKLLVTFLGRDNVSHISLQDLCNDRFMTANLFGKLANIHNDIPNNPLKYVGKLLQLTGGDPISAGVKHVQKPIRLTNTAKLSFAANTLPKTEVPTDAFFSRPLIVEFPNQFLPNNDNTDPHLIEKLTTPEELSGFLNLALTGLDTALKRGRIHYPFNPDQMRDQYQRFSDPLYSYVQENLVQDQMEAITKGKVYDDYVRYAKIHKLAVKKSNVFSREIRPYIIEMGGAVGHIDKDRAWRGVRLKTQEEKVEQKSMDDFHEK
jgi:putative DNA primase/helicase